MRPYCSLMRNIKSVTTLLLEKPFQVCIQPLVTLTHMKKKSIIIPIISNQIQRWVFLKVKPFQTSALTYPGTQTSFNFTNRRLTCSERHAGESASLLVAQTPLTAPTPWS